MKPSYSAKKPDRAIAALTFLALVVAAIAVTCVMPEIAAGQMANVAQTRVSDGARTSQTRGGHLYMQTNETRNAIVHYRWSKSGTLMEVERVLTGGAGSGIFRPIYEADGPNAFEGAGSVILTPDRRFLFTTN